MEPLKLFRRIHASNCHPTNTTSCHLTTASYYNSARLSTNSQGFRLQSRMVTSGGGCTEGPQ